MKSIAVYLLNYLVSYILLVSIVQSYFCVDLRLITLVFVSIVLGISVANSKKIFLERSDIIIISLLILLNVYYTFVELRGAIYFKSSYILFLSILLSKVILPNISSGIFHKKISTIYLVLLIGLVIEYLALYIFGSDIFQYMLCNAPSIQGYRPLHNVISSMLSINVPGLNSFMMGAQTASQLSVIIFIWYFYRHKVDNNRVYMILWMLSILMLFLSPSITSVILLSISTAIIYFIYLNDVYKKRIVNFYKLYILFIAIGLFVYILMHLFSRHNGLESIFEDLIMGQLFGFSDWNYKEVLMGVSIERKDDLFKVSEITFLRHLSLYGFIGFGVFYISIFYYIFRALIVNGLDCRTILVPSVIILIVFIFGNSHYGVMLQSGAMELFSLHLAYIIYNGSNKPKTQSF